MAKTTFNTKSENDLVKALGEKQTALRTFRFGLSGAGVKNVKEGRNLRKDIARIMTAMNIQKSSSSSQ